MRHFYLDGKIPVECSKEDLIKYKSNNIDTFIGYSTLEEFKDNNSISKKYAISVIMQ